MSENNDPTKTYTSASDKDADTYEDDFLDSTDSDERFDSSSRSFGQDSSYDPLSDDLFAQGNTVMFNDQEKQAKRSKWMIIGGVVLVAVALILALKLLAGGSEEPQITTPPAPVQAQPDPAPAAESGPTAEELDLLPTEIEVPMPNTQQQAEEQIDAFTAEQELLDEQMAMYEEQLATSKKITELKAAQIAALEKQLSQQASAADTAAPAGAQAPEPATQAATNQSTSGSSTNSAAQQP